MVSCAAFRPLRKASVNGIIVMRYQCPAPACAGGLVSVGRGPTYGEQNARWEGWSSSCWLRSPQCVIGDRRRVCCAAREGRIVRFADVAPFRAMLVAVGLGGCG